MRLRLSRLFAPRPGGRWRKMDAGLSLPESPGVVMLAAPTVIWVRSSDNIAQSVGGVIGESRALQVRYGRPAAAYVWWHCCSRSTADRWAVLLRRRLCPSRPAETVALEHFH